MKYLTINGLRLEYRDFSATRETGPSILLLHEGLGSIALWRHFPEQLAARSGCRVIVWSRAGYGGSEACRQPRHQRYMHDEGEKALPALVAALGITRPVLVGHSDGASIALIYAGAFPDAPLGVVAMAPHEFVEPETLAGIRDAREAWQSTDWPNKLARYHQDAERVFRDWNDTWLSPEFSGWNIEHYLPKIRCPVLALQGVDDEYATLRQIDVIAEKVPGTELLKLEQCGHSPHRDQPEKVLAAIAGFVERLGERWDKA